jgi:hypothetical protein
VARQTVGALAAAVLRAAECFTLRVFACLPLSAMPCCTAGSAAGASALRSLLRIQTQKNVVSRRVHSRVSSGVVAACRCVSRHLLQMWRWRGRCCELRALAFFPLRRVAARNLVLVVNECRATR